MTTPLAPAVEAVQKECQHCHVDRIIGGSEVYTFKVVDDNDQPDDDVDLHLQCVGKWARTNPNLWLLLPSSQLELPTEADNDEEED